MPLPRFRAAVANGNWSNSATWNNGEIPGPNDVVALNDYTVNIDQDINVYQITNRQLSYTSYNSFRLMTSDITPEGITTSSINDYRSYFPFSTSGLTLDVFATVANPLWYAYEYPAQQPIVLDRYTFNVLGNHPYDPRDWKFQGWNATTNTWVDLDTVTGQTTFPNSAYVSNVLSHTTAYYKYRIIATQTRYGDGTCRLWNIRFYEKNTYYTTTTLPRGTTNVTTSRNITIGEGNLVCVNFNTLMTMSSGAGTTVNFNGKVEPPYVSSTTIDTINITGQGTYNFTGEIVQGKSYGNQAGNTIRVAGTCVVNIYGNVYGNAANGNLTAGIFLSATGATVNVFGDVEGGNALYDLGAIHITGASNLNVYGNVYGARDTTIINYGNDGITCSNSGANIVVVGNVVASSVVGTGNQGWRVGMRIYSANSVQITGNLIAGTFYLSNPDQRFYAVYIGSVKTLSIIGTIQASDKEAALVTAVSVRNYETFSYNYQLSGPFVSGPTGIQPYRVSIFRLISNISKYYQFRDLNLNTTSMVSPNTLIDSPSPSDVRQGTVYANANYTGTLAVPPANRVSAGVPVDNTVGTGTVTAEDVWNYATANLNTDGSIGKRLKNAATVDSTGNQLSSLL